MKARGIAAALGLTALGLTALGMTAAAQAQTADQSRAVERSQTMVPSAPWPAGDQRGMGNTQGAGTWLRCAAHLSDPDARTYEVSHPRSATMPQSPFGVPLDFVFHPTASIPGTRHAFNDEHLASGQPGGQGTQFDALGHFAYFDEPWDGQGDIPAETANYYGGFKQADVKPTPDSPLLKLGLEHVPPIVTSAVLLDAKAFVGGGAAMTPGQTVTAAHIEGMLKAQGLGWRGILPGDVVYIYTGWSENWQDPDTDKRYYAMGPGLSYDAAQYLESKNIVLVALDNPFTDPVNDGMLMGKAGPAEGTPPGLPFAVHHHNLANAGIHQIQNANLAAMAADKVWTSCTIILPLIVTGGAGSPVRPVAIGAPGQ